MGNAHRLFAVEVRFVPISVAERNEREHRLQTLLHRSVMRWACQQVEEKADETAHAVTGT